MTTIAKRSLALVLGVLALGGAASAQADDSKAANEALQRYFVDALDSCKILDIKPSQKAKRGETPVEPAGVGNYIVSQFMRILPSSLTSAPASGGKAVWKGYQTTLHMLSQYTFEPSDSFALDNARLTRLAVGPIGGFTLTGTTDQQPYSKLWADCGSMVAAANRTTASAEYAAVAASVKANTSVALEASQNNHTAVSFSAGVYRNNLMDLFESAKQGQVPHSEAEMAALLGVWDRITAATDPLTQNSCYIPSFEGMVADVDTSFTMSKAADVKVDLSTQLGMSAASVASNAEVGLQTHTGAGGQVRKYDVWLFSKPQCLALPDGDKLKSIWDRYPSPQPIYDNLRSYVEVTEGAEARVTLPFKPIPGTWAEANVQVQALAPSDANLQSYRIERSNTAYPGPQAFAPHFDVRFTPKKEFMTSLRKSGGATLTLRLSVASKDIQRANGNLSLYVDYVVQVVPGQTYVTATSSTFERVTGTSADKGKWTTTLHFDDDKFKAIAIKNTEGGAQEVQVCYGSDEMLPWRAAIGSRIDLQPSPSVPGDAVLTVYTPLDALPGALPSHCWVDVGLTLTRRGGGAPAGTTVPVSLSLGTLKSDQIAFFPNDSVDLSTKIRPQAKTSDGRAFSAWLADWQGGATPAPSTAERNQQIQTLFPGAVGYLPVVKAWSISYAIWNGA